jgi:uncharacterized protein (TIGR02001 family)
MIKSRVYLGGALLAAAGAANAGVTVTPTIVSDYDFRGFTQTAKDPAFQLGVNYAHASGFYAFAWGSNLDGDSYPGADLELDVGLGFAGGDAKESFGYDVGVVAYTYPGLDLPGVATHYEEIYAGISKGWFAGKLWYSPEFAGASGDTSAFYVEGNGTFPLPQDFAFVAHVGYSFGDYWDDIEYVDWSAGFTKTFKNFSFALKYIDGSDYPDDPTTKVFDSKGKAWASISTTLPWAKE